MSKLQDDKDQTEKVEDDGTVDGDLPAPEEGNEDEDEDEDEEVTKFNATIKAIDFSSLKAAAFLKRDELYQKKVAERPSIRLATTGLGLHD